ncbi:MAG: ABC transporter permease [Ruminococcaceae bacterium]|nr:ABC transporter permease [Oscillospiraceae bacterium]
MTKYIVKRLLIAVLTVFIVATLTFFLMNAVPGGPYEAEKSISPQAKAALEAKFGLDQPLFKQYLTYLKNILHGDFGPSLKQRGRNVIDIILTKFPVSAKVGMISVLVSLLVGIPVGCIAAMNRGRVSDNAIIVIATVGIAVPSFVVCSLSMYFFGVKLRWLPTVGLMSWKNYIMPVFSLSFYPTTYIVRLMRSAMLDVLGQDYMRTAKAKGVSQRVSLFKHALRNAILPVVTYLGPMMAYTLTGSFIVEKVFTIPGLGGEFVSSISNRDYMMIMGTTIFLAALMVFINVVVDIVYKFIDPRIKLK